MKNLTDEELVDGYKNGNINYYSEIFERYGNVVKSRARAYFLVGGEVEDLISEGLIGLYKAMRDYDKTKSSFKTFAGLCVNRQILTAIKLATRNKHKPLNSYISLSSKSSDDEIDTENFICIDFIANPENIVIERENSDELKSYIVNNLSGMEMEILKLYLKGKAYAEISENLGKNVKTIDNALSRIRKKLIKFCI